METAKSQWEKFLRAIVARVRLENPGAEEAEVVRSFMDYLTSAGEIKKSADGKYIIPEIQEADELVRLVRLHNLH